MPQETHEPEMPSARPRGQVHVDLTGDEHGECLVVTIHEVRHFLQAATAQALNQALTKEITEWDVYAKAQGAPGVLPSKPDEPLQNRSALFDARQIAAELAQGRALTKPMVRGALEALGDDGALMMDHLPFLGFVERAQAFHQGTLDMIEQGNPLAAATLLRSFAENLAVVYYVDKRPAEFDKLRPGAQQGLSMGKVVAAAQKSLPGFKDIYDHLSSMAHPSGAGAFQTLDIKDDGAFTWQSSPNFRSTDDARTMLRWLEEIRELTSQIIEETAAEAGRAAARRLSSPA